MLAHAVSPRINSLRYDDAQLIQPVEPVTIGDGEPRDVSDVDAA